MTTRHDLSTNILGWLHRGTLKAPVDFDVIGAFIRAGEADINKDLRARCMVTRAVQPIDARYLPLPCDYLEALDLRLQSGGELIYEPRAVATGRPSPYGPGGVAYMVDANTLTSGDNPRHYTITGDTLEIWPIPAAPAAGRDWPVLEMAYYRKQALGPLDTDTTPVLTIYPDLYLYGALQHSAPFVRDDARVKVWSDFYQAQIFRANAEHERARTQGSRLVQRHSGAWGYP